MVVGNDAQKQLIIADGGKIREADIVQLFETRPGDYVGVTPELNRRTAGVAGEINNVGGPSEVIKNLNNRIQNRIAVELK